MKTDEMTSWIA